LHNEVLTVVELTFKSLPGGGSHKNRFRLVEKEGDFNILSEHEFSTSSKKSTLSWLTLINLASKVCETGE